MAVPKTIPASIRFPSSAGGTAFDVESSRARRRWKRDQEDTMPAKKEDLPSTIERSPKKVQRTYEKALDSAHEEYGSEERAHRTTWAAVKHVAEKKGDHWEPKQRKGPSDQQAAKGGTSARRGGKTHGGINANKPKHELYEDAKRARIEGRSRMNRRELVEALEKHSRRETAKARR
jgi:cation transport regulator ChaB